jgi:hypothetical protein
MLFHDTESSGGGALLAMACGRENVTNVLGAVTDRERRDHAG